MEITLDEIKLQCRIDNDDEDDLLSAYLVAAKAMVENHTNRVLFNTLPEEKPINAQEITGDLKIAILMLIAYLYENRGGWNEGQGVTNFDLPPTVKAIIERYRFICVGN
ncbi:MAG: head-tail connector protein [Haemophilus parainfluenzae]